MGVDALDQRAIDAGDDRARRHAEQGRAGRERDPRRLAGRRPARRPTSVGLPLYRYVGGTDAHVLPVPMMNIINGGAHADNNIDLQEFMVVPLGARALRRGAADRRRDLPRAEGVLKERGLVTAVGDEGGFAPDLASNEEAIAAILEAVETRRPPATTSRSRSTPASTEFYARRRATGWPARAASSTPPRWWTTGEALCDRYPIVSIEDGLAEDDWDGWQLLTERLGGRVQLVGDDLFVTNAERLAAGHRRAARPTRSWSR